MTGQTRLLGCADTVGKSIGFLIPVFDQQGSNALLVQRVSSAGTIVDFEEVENVDAQITYIDPEAVAVGEEAIFAFAFAQDDILTERASAFRAALASRIDDPALAERPLLSVEVAEFLELANRRLDFAKAAFERIREASPRAARGWLDLSILTPDLRKALSRYRPELSAAAQRIVATVEGDQVVIGGVPSFTADSLGFELPQTATDVLRGLERLYPPPPGGWTVRVLRSQQRRRTAAPEAVVWLADREDSRAQPFIQDDFAWRVDAYRSDELEEFRLAIEEPKTTGFIVLRGKQVAVSREIESVSGAEVATIEFGSLTRFKAEGPELLLSYSPRPTIHVPAPGLPGTRNSPKAVGRTVRQIVAMALATRSQRVGPMLEGAWVFFRARGFGVSPEADAWAALYDRTWSAGLPAHDVYCVGGRGRGAVADGGYTGWWRETLFPSAVPIQDQRTDIEMRNARMDAAVLLAVEAQRPQDWVKHRHAVEAVLVGRGWNPIGTTRTTDEWTLEVERAGNIRFVQTRAATVKSKPTWKLSTLLRDGLVDIETIAVTCDATAPVILAHLSAYRTLPVNMRDICGAHAEGGIWLILGAQLLRLASGQMNRARSHFMALLLNHAFDHGQVDFEEAGALHEAIHGPSLGREVQLSWSKVHQTSEEIRASVRLLAGVSNQYLQHGADLIAPFTIVLTANGVELRREYLD